MDEKTDELARNAVLRALADELGVRESSVRTAAAVVAAHAVTWERDVNSAGKAVRRYVLRGAWEVDPEAVKP